MSKTSTSSPVPDTSSATNVADLEAKLRSLEQEIVGVYEHAPFGSHTLDADGTFLAVNKRELAWIGSSSEALIGKKKFLDCLSEKSRSRFQAVYSEAFANGSIENMELVLLGKEGEERPIALSSVGVKDTAGNVIKHRAVIFDTTQNRQHELQQRIASVAFESLSGMCVTDSQGAIIRVNNAFVRVTGYGPQEVIGKTPLMLISGQHEKARYQAIQASVLAHGVWHGEVASRRRDGQLHTVWLSINKVMGEDGATTHYIGSFVDITAMKSAEAAALHCAAHDALTQLPNRRSLEELTAKAAARARLSGCGGAMMLIDLDHFKLINDTRGHDVGDQVLIETVHRLRGVLSRADSLARLGGDEFVVLLEELSGTPREAEAQARRVGEEILAVLSEDYVFDHFTCRSSGSIGLDMFSDAANYADLLKHVDLALYQSKYGGRNTLRFFFANMQNVVSDRITLEEDLRQGLVRHEFILHYQPQVNHVGGIVGAEALVRWLHPERGLICPGEFMAVAEETGLILPLGQWVLETACAQLKRWEGDARTGQLELSVNVSAYQFRQPDFVASVKQVVAASDINPARLRLELTESMVFNVDNTIEKMNALREVGVMFVLDDFGTGYSSLSSLTRLPLSQIKIDQSFVRNIGIQPTDSVIIQTIIAMADALDMDVVAEGVETEQQFAFLHRNGCNLFQGYLYSRPVPADAFDAFMNRAGRLADVSCWQS
jgi:diguanylate cyclase (GGDEF)-like protein/PAS domain S-box-containing protein